jgi:Response regulator containing a CheY-like receiver domain and an HTH DNA-binding domain
MTIKVVVVDDHQLFIDGIKAILKKDLGIEVIGQANNGFELLKLLERGIKVDVIMIDIRMPVMDGIMTTRVLKKEYPDIAVLVLSMYNQEEDLQEMISAGARGYLVKNASKAEMVEAVHAVYNKKEFVSAELKSEHNAPTREYLTKIKLTRREKEILNLVAKGRTSLQIANTLTISKMTVDTHRKNIHKKLGISSNAGLVRYALQELK